MKKMIVIAALIGGMLMPAQIMAQNNRKNEKPRIEKREKRDNYKNMKPGKNEKKPGKQFGKYNKPAPPPVVIVNRPSPRPCPPPPPPPPARYCYKNNCGDVFGAAATVIGIAALVSLIAN